MGNFKLNLDRPKMSPDEIQAKQNFDDVLTKFKASQAPIYKNPWFWGSAGLASVGLASIVSLNAYSNNQQNESHDKIATQQELPADTKCIQAPIKNEDIPFDTFVVDPMQAEQLTLASGTVIEIAKNSLQVKDVSQPVEIKVREFHDKTSAFVAGIPMDHEGNTAFESAGMIEIRGYQHDELVAINPNEPIQVSLTTHKDPSQFGFWNLNEKTGEWQTYPAQQVNHTASAITAHSKSDYTSKKSGIEAQISSKEQQIQSVVKKIKATKEPLVEAYKLPKAGRNKFDLDFDKKDYPELAKFDQLVFEVVPESGYDKNFTKKNWEEVALDKKNGQYIMNFSSAADKFSIEVRPILKGRELQEAQKEFDVAIRSYKATKTTLEKEKVNLEAEKAQHELSLKKLMQETVLEKNTEKLVVNEQTGTLANQQKIGQLRADIEASTSSMKFEVRRWGLFNSDNPVSYPEPLAYEPALLWEGVAVPAKFKALYVFDLDKDVRYSYFANSPTQGLENLGLNKRSDVVIIGIDYAGELGYVSLKKRPKHEQLEKLVFKRKKGKENTQELLQSLLREQAVAA